MKRERNREKHDYNKVDANEKYAAIRSKEYYGIFVRNGRVHVDTKRFKKELKDLNAMEFWKDGMSTNRPTPYLIPKKKHRDEYYVNMAVAWALSVAFVKFEEKVYKIIEENRLSAWVHNKTIQKICESNRVDKNTKDALKKLKIK